MTYEEWIERAEAHWLAAKAENERADRRRRWVRAIWIIVLWTAAFGAAFLLRLTPMPDQAQMLAGVFFGACAWWGTMWAWELTRPRR